MVDETNLFELQEEVVFKNVETCMVAHIQNACFYVTQMHTHCLAPLQWG